MDAPELLLLAAVGAVAGFVNVMAGGGSLLTMPTMIFLGMDPATANGTNRVALVAQNAASVAQFARRGFSDARLSLTLGMATIPGAIAGAVVAIRIDPEVFKTLLAAVMVVVLVLTLRGSPSATAVRTSHPGWAHTGMILVGFYGGFIQAGVGFLFMAIARGFLALDLVRVNMHKVFVIGMYMLPSLLVFATTGDVVWLAGGCLAVGNVIGAVIATRTQIRGGEKVVRIVLAVAVAAMAIKLVLS